MTGEAADNRGMRARTTVRSVTMIACLGVAACSSSSSSSPAGDAGGDTPVEGGGDACGAQGGSCLLVSAPNLGGHCPARWTLGTGCPASPNLECCIPPAGGSNGERCTSTGGACVDASACDVANERADQNDCADPASHACCAPSSDAGSDGG
jgi:hypothetical protein